MSESCEKHLDAQKLGIESALRERGFIPNISVTMRKINMYGINLTSMNSPLYLIEHGWSQYIVLNLQRSSQLRKDKFQQYNICLGQICKTADQLVLDGHYEEALDIVIAVLIQNNFSLSGDGHYQ